MTRTVLFARHGNTFAPGEKAVWVGRGTDLPLVERGLAQAEEAARAIAATGLKPDAIYAASLRRTREFATIIAEKLDLAPPVIDKRLDELDYGAWEGKDNDAIAALGPKAAADMEAWSTHDAWPETAGWGSVKAEILAGLRAFVAERLDAPVTLVVSSNGILRFLPRLLLSDGEERDSFRMRTGHLGRIDGARLIAWDTPTLEGSK